MTFVDSPGLVDGDMKYPFDVDEVILWLGESSPSDTFCCYCLIKTSLCHPELYGNSGRVQ